MARIMSFVMIVFSLVPALAPTMGNYIVIWFGWRAIFIAFVIFSLITLAWLMIRQPETLAKQNRRPLSIMALMSATKEMFAHRTARLSILIQTLTFGMLFLVLSSTQQVFDQTFDQGHNFHLWFGAIAVIAASGSFLNARIVVRVGMRAIIKTMYMVQICLTILMIAVTISDAPYWLAFGAYLLWVQGNFYQAGLTIGNLNALAMEEMGHIAGLAASIIAAFSTIGAVIIAAPIGLAFDGTPLPMALGELGLVILALWLTTMIRRPGEEA
jgi:DHA1 family bicyclomycin/chloramphenicol resistance-like MFS transporter